MDHSNSSSSSRKSHHHSSHRSRTDNPKRSLDDSAYTGRRSINRDQKQEKKPKYSDYTNSASASNDGSKDDLNRLKAKALKSQLLLSSDSESDPNYTETTAQKSEKYSSPTKSLKEDTTTRTNNEKSPSQETKPTLSSDSKEKPKDNYPNISNKNMALSEKFGAEDEQLNAEFLKKVMKYKEGFDTSTLENLDDLYDNAEYLASSSISKSKVDPKQGLLESYQKSEQASTKCIFCFNEIKDSHDEHSIKSSGVMAPKVPVLAIGYYTYLSLPLTEPLTDGQCSINTIEHSPSGSSLVLDQDVWDEIRNFQKSLMMMFHEKGYGTIFMETNIPSYSKTGSTSFNRHISIDCIPIPYKDSLFQSAPIYFKQAILSSDEEWSTHKKLYDTRIQKHESNGLFKRGGFKNSMSPKVPYFHVWFDLDGGYGHVIENSRFFPPYFGFEVVSGILNLPPSLFLKPKKVLFNQSQKSKAIKDFVTEFNWDKFDWTSGIEH
ncbi:hypothetical protein BB560_000933 [Smittium megazygosporum]|uniref:Cwf19-like C-terminal domain-containing protein n=1 Tax=Smittium megazygosporum TaxID=133381 RepID=A0A2T9ZIX9_9FUNG|nr:hypothetical protein BB560_000933 [Smittium megazygosporum]